jgi:ribonuclease HI
MLTGWKTQLRFNDFTSNWIDIWNGISQGDLLMIAYLIYNADIIDIVNPKNNKTALAFVEDTAYIAIGTTFKCTHDILKNMVERPKGALQWSREHNSKFKVNKFALIDFTHSRTREPPLLVIQNTTILPTEHHQFLGLIVDQELDWKLHSAQAIAKGMKYVLQIWHLSRPTNGISVKLMRQLYITVAIPKFTYGADIWFCPIYKEDSNVLQRGSMGIANHLAKVKHIAMLSITGAMRSTATDTLNAHANLLPTGLMLLRVCHQAALCLATLPECHPLSKHLKHIAHHYNIQHHHSSIHNLLTTFKTFPATIETLDPICRSNVWEPIDYNIHIAMKKDQAIKEQHKLKEKIQVFTDGSSHDGGVGASAVLTWEGKPPHTLKYYLGTDKTHTVYEAELVGLTLAAKLLAMEQNVVYLASIFIDNRAAIQSSESYNTKPGSYLVENFFRMTKYLVQKRNEREQNFDLTICWIPGYAGVLGNKLADKVVKKAAEGRMNSSDKECLPCYLQKGRLPQCLGTPPMAWAHLKKAMV